MTRRTNIVEQVGSYFASKGRVMTADEYKNAEDVPIRFQLVKRGIGSWSRLLNMVGDISQYSGENVVVSAPSAPAPELDKEPVEEPTEAPAVAPEADTSKKPVKG